jgi:rRNA maturation protein Nop10
MKYCKKCGVLYTTDVCPKCGVLKPEASEPPEPAPQKTVRRQWIALVIAIPATILLILGVLKLLQLLQQS